MPPPLFGRITEGIAKAGRAGGSRVMVEFPFGLDLASARRLNATMHAYFPEDAIYRVDHWLGLDPAGQPDSGGPEVGDRTYAAIRVVADSWRWADVRILIRAGKCLPVTATEVTIGFRRPPHDAFGLGEAMPTNTLRFRINPQNRVSLTLTGKKPGAGWQPEAEELCFAEHPGEDCSPTTGSSAPRSTGKRWLFASQDTVEAAWRVVDPVLGDVVPCTPTPGAAGVPPRPLTCFPTGKAGRIRHAR